MLDKIVKFMENRVIVTFILFFLFILIFLIVLNSFYSNTVPFKKEYLYLLHFLVFYLDVYLVLYIWKTKDFILDSRFVFLIALNLLIYTPFYIILNQQKIAEQLSIRAYYVMVVWVLLEMFLTILNSKLKKNEQ